MKYRFIGVLIFYSFLNGCKPSDQSNERGNEVIQSNPMTQATDQDFADIYSKYHTDPRSQFQIDENKIIDFIADQEWNAKRLESGIYYVVHKHGEGPLIKRGQPIKADYKGYFPDGTVFDSSYKKGKPIRFTVGQMVSGWNEGLTYLQIGTKATLLIPSYLGYAEEGFPGFVGPNEVLIFDMEIYPYQ